ncbi:MAG TPA: hypothetical protein VLA16_09560 [Ideonella sp.]|nr:hypothetical protein [Ideonella sp.]
MDHARRATILLFGDLLRHIILEPGSFCPGQDAVGGYIGHIRRAITPLLPAMIDEALAEAPDELSPGRERPWRVLPDFRGMQADDLLRSMQGFGELHSVLDRFPVNSSSRASDKKVLRVKYQQLATSTQLSLDAASSAAPDREQYLSWVIGRIEQELAGEEPGEPTRIGLLYDHNSRFRESVSGLTGSERERMSALLGGCRAGAVLAIKDNIRATWLTEACKLCFPGARQAGDRRIAIVLADALRKSDLGIMELGAFETSANDIVGHLDKSPLNELREHCAHIVIVFREAGALHIDNDGGVSSISFAPNYDRHAQMHPERYGSMPGKFTTIVTAVLRELHRASLPAEAGRPLDIAAALRLGVLAYNLHFDLGLAKDDRYDIATPLDAFKRVLGPKRRAHLKTQTRERKTEYLLTTIEIDLDKARERNWHRYDDHFSRPRDDGATPGELLERLVKHGLEHEFRVPAQPDDNRPYWSPAKVIDLPYAEFGHTKMLVYQEIEQYNTLAKIIDKYLGQSSWATPLSIAVFGQPGSGKSFAVKQVLKKVSPDRKSEPLTFNIAQFDSVDQLTEAFHKVQDSGLASPEVPLVIFDEFDANLGTAPLGWLKYFLAPMQDGLFRGKSQDYRVGRAIFLFSGGTSSTFKIFNDLIEPPGAKRNDFLSRLRGYLDVAGINPDDGHWPEDAPAQTLKIRLRRAVLLRSLMEQHTAFAMKNTSGELKVAQMSSDLIKAFLYTTAYRHGVRSMEALLQMIRPIDDQLVTASLPPVDQLAAHVDGDSFVAELSGYPLRH